MSLFINDLTPIITLNNEGATSLVSGDVATAISNFSQALFRSKSSLGQRKEHGMKDRENTTDRSGDCRQRDDVHQDEYHEERCHPYNRKPQFGVDNFLVAECFRVCSLEENLQQTQSLEQENRAKALTLDSSSDAHSGLQDDKMYANKGSAGNDFACDDFIYSKPINIPELHSRCDWLQLSDMTLPSIVIFNMALAYHLWAIKISSAHAQQSDVTSSTFQGSSPSSLLKKSVSLYGLAIQLQERQLFSDGLKCRSKLFLLSCINNLGNTHRLLGDAIASQQVYEHLFSLIIYLNYCEQQKGTERSIPPTTDLNNRTSINSSSPAGRLPPNIAQTESTLHDYFLRNIFRTEMNAASAA